MPKETPASNPDKSIITNELSEGNSLGSKPSATSRFKARNANGVLRLTVTRDG
jgi:hypothetical protein